MFICISLKLVLLFYCMINPDCSISSDWTARAKLRQTRWYLNDQYVSIIEEVMDIFLISVFCDPCEISCPGTIAISLDLHLSRGLMKIQYPEFSIYHNSKNIRNWPRCQITFLKLLKNIILFTFLTVHAKTLKRHLHLETGTEYPNVCFSIVASLFHILRLLYILDITYSYNFPYSSW